MSAAVANFISTMVKAGYISVHDLHLAPVQITTKSKSQWSRQDTSVYTIFIWLQCRQQQKVCHTLLINKTDNLAIRPVSLHHPFDLIFL